MYKLQTTEKMDFFIYCQAQGDRGEQDQNFVLFYPTFVLLKVTAISTSLSAISRSINR